MSELPKIKQVSGDRKKTRNGKGLLIKKIYQKVAEKQLDDVGNLSMNVGNNQAANVVTKSKPKLQHISLNATKNAAKNLITKPVMKSSTQKTLAKKNLTLKQQVLEIKKSRPPGAKNTNSITITKDETKKIKPAKRVLKSIPITVMMPRNTDSDQADRKKLTNLSEKQKIKVKRVLRKKHKTSLNGKTTKPKTGGSIALENVLPISYSTKLLPAMTKQI